MKKLLIIFCLALFVLSYNIGFAADQPARDLTASLGLYEGLVDSADKGAFVDVVKAIAEIYTGKIKIEVYPMAFSVDNVVQGRADFHMATIRNPGIPVSQLPYQYVSESIYTVPVVIYSNKDKIITHQMIMDALANGGKFPYSIEVVRGFEKECRFPVIPSGAGNDPAPSLEKVQNHRIDAFLARQAVSDPCLRRLKLNKIHRELHQEFDYVFVVQKGPKGDELNKILSDCLRKLKASGKLQEILKNYYGSYNNWQPTDMGW